MDEFIDGIKDKGKPIIDIVKILEIRLWKNRKNPKIKKLAEKICYNAHYAIHGVARGATP